MTISLSFKVISKLKSLVNKTDLIERKESSLLEIDDLEDVDQAADDTCQNLLEFGANNAHNFGLMEALENLDTALIVSPVLGFVYLTNLPMTELRYLHLPFYFYS